MKDIILKVCLCILAYLVGAINFARVFAKFKKIDITKEGSGNPGTMNALRTAGKMVGLFTFIFDVVKGLAFG
ncbi:MAG: glycerol-3-phosphate acyltransferase, partial [Clostridia bacterium]